MCIRIGVALLATAIAMTALAQTDTRPPDLPGCVATGATVEKAEREIREAIEFHLESLREDGSPIPSPSSAVRYVDVAA